MKISIFTQMSRIVFFVVILSVVSGDETFSKTIDELKKCGADIEPAFSGFSVFYANLIAALPPDSISFSESILNCGLNLVNETKNNDTILQTDSTGDCSENLSKLTPKNGETFGQAIKTFIHEFINNPARNESTIEQAMRNCTTKMKGLPSGENLASSLDKLAANLKKGYNAKTVGDIVKELASHFKTGLIGDKIAVQLKSCAYKLTSLKSLDDAVGKELIKPMETLIAEVQKLPNSGNVLSAIDECAALVNFDPQSSQILTDKMVGKSIHECAAKVQSKGGSTTIVQAIEKLAKVFGKVGKGLLLGKEIESCVSGFSNIEFKGGEKVGNMVDKFAQTVQYMSDGFDERIQQIKLMEQISNKLESLKNDGSLVQNIVAEIGKHFGNAKGNNDGSCEAFADLGKHANCEDGTRKNLTDALNRFSNSAAAAGKIEGLPEVVNAINSLSKKEFGNSTFSTVILTLLSICFIISTIALGFFIFSKD